MKRIIILSLVFLFLSARPSFAEKVYYRVIDEINKTVSVQATIYEDGQAGDLVIPETIRIKDDDYTVVEIPDEGFSGTHYSSITIPNTVTSIGEAAFYYCANLEYVTIGAGILKIGRRPFQGCEHLRELTFLSEIPPYIEKNHITEYIGHTITIKTDKKYIMNYACLYGMSKGSVFQSFSSDRLLSTYFDDNYEYLACDETKECIITKYLRPETMITDLVIPDNAKIMFGLASEEYKVVGIGPLVFSKPLSVDREYAPENFEKNVNISGNVTMGKNIRGIGYGAFAATNMNALRINDNVKVIENNTFLECRELKEVSFNQKLKWIGNKAFMCTGVSELSLPEDLLLIGFDAFSGLADLRHIEFNESLGYIESRAFYMAGNLESIILPDGLKKIGDYAFASCTSLSNVKFGRNLEVIGSQSFKETAIKRIEIPPYVKSIGNYAFFDCGLKEAFFEDGLYPIKIGEDAIDCNNLEYLYMGRDFSMTQPSFKQLQTVEIGNLVSKIPDSAFKNSLRLTSVSIGSGLKEIGAEAFKYCSLSEIVIPSNVQLVGAEGFAGNRLNSITIGSGLAELGNKAFEGNANLSVINITAPMPPTANVNVFTNYGARLNLDSRYAAGYKESNLCWSMFKRYDLINVDKIALDSDIVEYCSGEQYQLNAFILPENASLQTILWESSNPNVAIVNTSGLVKIIDDPSGDSSEANRSCNILAYTLYSDGPVARCTFANNLHVSSISITPDKVMGQEGDQIQLNATIEPQYAANKTLAWSSSDESVMKVDNNGLVSLLQEGTATITASATDGSSVTAECAVVVTENAGIGDILTDKNTYVKIFNLSGVLVYEGIYSDANLVPDYYIVVCDGKNIKVIRVE